MKRNISNDEQIFLFQELFAGGFIFFVGVPDSALKDFIGAIDKAGVPHVVATHESQALGMAVGAELAGKKSCVYLQNSGLGNLINPIASLCHPFEIFPLLVVGHRHTLPQHKVMGEIDHQILELVRYPNYVIVYGDNNVR